MPITVRRPVAPIRRPTVPATRRGAPINTRPSKDLVTTATLMRGRIYIFKDVSFERGQPVAIDDELMRVHPALNRSAEQLAFDLQDLFEPVTDSDGERFEKPIFEIKHNQPRPLTAKQEADRTRPRRIRQFVDVPEHGKPAPATSRAPHRSHRV